MIAGQLKPHLASTLSTDLWRIAYAAAVEGIGQENAACSASLLVCDVHVIIHIYIYVCVTDVIPMSLILL